MLLDSTSFCLQTTLCVSAYAPLLRVSQNSLTLSRNWDVFDTEFSLEEWQTLDRSTLASLSCKYNGKTNKTYLLIVQVRFKRENRDVLQQNHKSMSYSVCGRMMVNLHKLVLFCKILGLVTCNRVHIGQRTERHIHWIVAMVNLVRIWNLHKSRWWSCRRADWNANEKWRNAQWWRNHQRKCAVCHAALNVKRNECFANTTLHCDLSREDLQPPAHVVHVKTDDKHWHD